MALKISSICIILTYVVYEKSKNRYTIVHCTKFISYSGNYVLERYSFMFETAYMTQTHTCTQNHHLINIICNSTVLVQKFNKFKQIQ